MLRGAGREALQFNPATPRTIPNAPGLAASNAYRRDMRTAFRAEGKLAGAISAITRAPSMAGSELRALNRNVERSRDSRTSTGEQELQFQRNLEPLLMSLVVLKCGFCCVTPQHPTTERFASLVFRFRGGR